MKLRLWAALAVALQLASAQDNGEEWLGPTGANNDTTPTAKVGKKTIHYVTVGKIEHEFQVSCGLSGI